MDQYWSDVVLQETDVTLTKSIGPAPNFEPETEITQGYIKDAIPMGQNP